MKSLAEALAPYRIAIALALPTIVIGAITTATSYKNIVFFPVLLGVIFACAAITLFIVLPVFFLMRYMGWLQWGYALASGMFAGLLVSLIFGGSKIDQMVAIGGAFGLLIWWVGVFRNPKYPDVSARIPWAMAMLIPIVSLWAWYRL